jgi:hypothetical protein
MAKYDETECDINVKDYKMNKQALILLAKFRNLQDTDQ